MDLVSPQHKHQFREIFGETEGKERCTKAGPQDENTEHRNETTEAFEPKEESTTLQFTSMAVIEFLASSIQKMSEFDLFFPNFECICQEI